MKTLRLGYHVKTSPDIISHLEHIDDLYIQNRFDTTPYGIAAQIFTKAPAQFAMSKLPERLDLTETKEYCQRRDIFIVIHGIYLTNFCNYDASERARQSVIEDMYLIQNLSPDPKHSGVVVHLGSNNFKGTVDQCIQNFCDNLVDCIESSPGNASILLETSVKSKNNNEIFHDIVQLGLLYKNIPIKIKNRIGFVIDTCHVFSSGYDIRSKQGFLTFMQLWDAHIGIDVIRLFHLNDSKLGLQSCRDLHEEIGLGHIFADRQDGLQAILSFCKNQNIPIVMETKSDNEREFAFLSKFIRKA